MHAKPNTHQGQQVSELPLIFFTLLTPMSVGVSAFALLRGSGLVFALMAALLAAAGMAASVAHLARPLRAPYSILHWKTSWLSREILAVSAYFGIVVLWCLAVFLAPSMGALLAVLAVALNALALACGLALLFVIARAYRVAPIPAWDGSENVLELLAVALGPGVALAMAAGSCFAVTDMLAAFIAIASLIATLALVLLANRRRIARLEAVDDRHAVAASLTRCQSLQAKVRFCRMLDVAALVVAALSMLFIDADLLFASAWAIAVAIEVISHCMARATFYELPVQERSVPRIR